MSKHTHLENELHPELLGVNALNPWSRHNSSPRGAMFGGHIAQALVVDGASPPRCMSGVEVEYGKRTYKVVMPVDAEVIKVIERYPSRIGGGFKENPETVVIYEDFNTKEVGILRLKRYHSLDRQFGFRYKVNKEAMAKLYPGAHIAKGTVLQDSPAVGDEGEYSYGVVANTAFMSVPAVIEDGVVVRRGFLNEMATTGYEERAVSWGKNMYPVNLYGDENNYKPFPDIGDKVRDDGLIIALRPYDDYLAVTDMTPEALMKPDYYYDTLYYAEPNAKIVDVIVHHDINAQRHPTPVGMETQTERYRLATSIFYESLMEVYLNLKGRRKDALKISKEFQRLLVEAQADKALVDDFRSKKKERVTRTYRRNPIDDWRVELIYEYKIIPTIGFKLTDIHGGKAVIVDVWDDEDMPVDVEGKRADMIMDSDSTIKRMNLGRMYEQYINATSFTVTRQVRELCERGEDNKAWEHLMGYYKIISPLIYEALSEGVVTPQEHLSKVVEDGIYLYLPSDNKVSYMEAVKELKEKYPTPIEPVTYRGRSGNMVTTQMPVLIGSMYIMLLEKTGAGWSGVSSSKLQHFGIPAKLTNADKHSAPGRASPVRFLGETEVRLLSAFIGADVVADLLDQSNNPTVHKEITYNLLKAETPGNIDRIIDREKYPIGRSRALVFLRHMLQCAGIEIKIPSINRKRSS